MTGYINEFNSNKNKTNNKNTNINSTTISLKVKCKQVLKNYNKIWKKIESLRSIDFDSKPTYDDKYMKKKRTFEDSIITNFNDKKISEEKIPCTCISIIMLDSVLYACEMYHRQTYLEECKYKQQQQEKQQKQQQQKNYVDEELKSERDSNAETKSDTDTNDNK